MLTQTVVLTSVCSDSLESAFAFPSSDGDWAAPGAAGSRALVGTRHSAQQWGNTQLEAKCCGVCAPLNEGWGINSDKTFPSAKTAEKPQLEHVGRPQDARKAEETSLCAFWHLQCQLLSLPWFFSQCCNGLHFNPQGDLTIVWCPTPIYKLYLRIGAVTPHAFIFPFPIMPYIHSIWYQDLKQTDLSPGQTVTSIKNVWENMYPRKCLPSGEN